MRLSPGAEDTDSDLALDIHPGVSLIDALLAVDHDARRAVVSALGLAGALALRSACKRAKSFVDPHLEIEPLRHVVKCVEGPLGWTPRVSALLTALSSWPCCKTLILEAELDPALPNPSFLHEPLKGLQTGLTDIRSFTFRVGQSPELAHKQAGQLLARVVGRELDYRCTGLLPLWSRNLAELGLLGSPMAFSHDLAAALAGAFPNLEALALQGTWALSTALECANQPLSDSLANSSVASASGSATSTSPATNSGLHKSARDSSSSSSCPGAGMSPGGATGSTMYSTISSNIVSTVPATADWLTRRLSSHQQLCDACAPFTPFAALSSSRLPHLTALSIPATLAAAPGLGLLRQLRHLAITATHASGGAPLLPADLRQLPLLSSLTVQGGASEQWEWLGSLAALPRLSLLRLRAHTAVLALGGDGGGGRGRGGGGGATEVPKMAVTTDMDLDLENHVVQIHSTMEVRHLAGCLRMCESILASRAAPSGASHRGISAGNGGGSRRGGGSGSTSSGGVGGSGTGSRGAGGGPAAVASALTPAVAAMRMEAPLMGTTTKEPKAAAGAEAGEEQEPAAVAAGPSESPSAAPLTHLVPTSSPSAPVLAAAADADADAAAADADADAAAAAADADACSGAVSQPAADQGAGSGHPSRSSSSGGYGDGGGSGGGGGGSQYTAWDGAGGLLRHATLQCLDLSPPGTNFSDLSFLERFRDSDPSRAHPRLQADGHTRTLQPLPATSAAASAAAAATSRPYGSDLPHPPNHAPSSAPGQAQARLVVSQLRVCWYEMATCLEQVLRLCSGGDGGAASGNRGAGAGGGGLTSMQLVCSWGSEMLMRRLMRDVAALHAAGLLPPDVCLVVPEEVREGQLSRLLQTHPQLAGTVTIRAAGGGNGAAGGGGGCGSSGGAASGGC